MIINTIPAVYIIQYYILIFIDFGTKSMTDIVINIIEIKIVSGQFLNLSRK